MATVRVDLHRLQISNFLYNPAGEVVRGVRRWSNAVHDRAVTRAPKASGRLASSGSVEMNTYPGLVVGVIRFKAPHALWVHEGTGVYGHRRRPIRSPRGRVMRFRSTGSRRVTRGAYTYAWSVRGQRPNPFLVWALRAAMTAPRVRIVVYGP